MATLAIITSSEHRALGWVWTAGISAWLTGFAIEVVADRKASAFKDPANTLWTGVAIIALRLMSGWPWVVLISPLFVYLLISRVSGVPMLEARADKRRWRRTGTRGP